MPSREEFTICEFVSNPPDESLVVLLNDDATLIVAALRANRVRWNSNTALRAVSDLAFFHAIVATAFTGAAVGVFTLWDSHGCGPLLECIGIVSSRVS